MEPCITNTNNKYYKYAIQREINLGKEGRPAPEKWPPSLDLHPLVNRYRNQKIFGIDTDGEMDWYKLFIEKYKCMEKGLTLGSGTGRHQKMLFDIGFVRKWDSIDIIKAKGEVITDSSLNVSNINDLNFIQLPENEYPFVFCHAVLHHIVNLEHLLYEINKTLTNDGIFILVEYCGENKWQWEDEKIKIINTEIQNRFGTKYPEFKISRPNMVMMSSRPLESIRSAEIFPLIKKIFKNSTEFEMHCNRILYPVLNSMWRVFKQEELINNKESLDEILDFVIQLDKEFDIQENNLLPTELIGIYGKNKDLKPIPARKWSDKEIKNKLGSHYPFYIKMKLYLRKFKFLRKINHSFKRISNI